MGTAGGTAGGSVELSVTVFGFLLASIYHHFDNFFAGRAAIFTEIPPQQNDSLVI